MVLVNVFNIIQMQYVVDQSIDWFITYLFVFTYFGKSLLTETAVDLHV